MLSVEDYQKISQFKDIVHRFHFLDKGYDAFRKYVCEALSEQFGFQHILFGYLNHTKSKEISLQVLVHNMPETFVERFFTSGALNEKRFHSNEDVIIYSRDEHYRKHALFRDHMAQQDYSDFALCYLSVNRLYVGYLVIFHDKQQRVFTSREIEILREIRDYISVEYHNSLSIIQLNNTNRLLLSQSNYYPVGVVIMRDVMRVEYMNETAREYLGELNTSPQFFSVFYNNQLVPYIKNDLLHLGSKQIVRYKNFIFSIVVTNVLTEDFFQELERVKDVESPRPSLNYTPNVSSYIYILRDDLGVHLQKGNPYEAYGFTEREKAVANLLMRGKSPAEIAEDLKISPNTAKVHIQKLYKKTNASNRAEFLFIIHQYKGPEEKGLSQ